MSDVPVWAFRLRVERRNRLWSQRDMARELTEAACDRNRDRLPGRESLTRMIRDWEAGRHKPKDPYRLLYCRVFGADETDLFRDSAPRLMDRGPCIGADLDEATPDEGHQSQLLDLPRHGAANYKSGGTLDPLTLAWILGRLSQRTDRRTLLQLAATVTTSVTLDPTERLLRALAGDHQPDNVTVSHLEARTRGFHRLEEHFPAHALYPALMTHLGEVGALLENRPAESVRKRLAVTVGESALLAAWFAWEMKDAKQAASISRLIGMAAIHGHDPAISAVWTGYRTYMTGSDNAHGVRLAEIALDRLGGADPATRAWLLARMAEEAALAGDKSTALAAIARAEEVYAAADINARPWTCFLDAARFASMRLAVYTRVRHEGNSVTALDAIMTHLGPEPEVKKLCVVKADMAVARIRLGDIKEGVAYARSSLAVTHTMSAPLGWDRLDQVAKELRKSRTAVAREFRAEFAATRPKETQPSLP